MDNEASVIAKRALLSIRVIWARMEGRAPPAGVLFAGEDLEVLPNGYSERTLVGAENSVSFAVHKTVMAMAFDEIKSLTKELFMLIDGIYGYLNPSDGWDYSVGSFRGCLMDLRVRDILAHRYGHGTKYEMTERIPGLYRGNILTKAHFTDFDTGFPLLTRFAHTERWQRGAIYVRFSGDPQSDPQIMQSSKSYFNLTDDSGVNNNQ